MGITLLGLSYSLKKTMNNKLTAKQREHIGRVKMLGCSVCDKPGPSDAHHIEQALQYCVVALCRDCHNSWHGTKAIWRVKKMDELKALNRTIENYVNEFLKSQKVGDF